MTGTWVGHALLAMSRVAGPGSCPRAHPSPPRAATRRQAAARPPNSCCRVIGGMDGWRFRDLEPLSRACVEPSAHRSTCLHAESVKSVLGRAPVKHRGIEAVSYT